METVAILKLKEVLRRSIKNGLESFSSQNLIRLTRLLIIIIAPHLFFSRSTLKQTKNWNGIKTDVLIKLTNSNIESKTN